MKFLIAAFALILKISPSAAVGECNSNPCQESAPCVESSDGYLCQCPVGYNGQDCQMISPGGAGSRNCGMNYFTPSGVITSPNYPANYNNNEECDYLVRVNTATTIYFFVDSFDSEFVKDVLSYGAGPDIPNLSDPSSGNFETLSGNFSNINFSFNSSQAWFNWFTDRTIPRRGFSIRYEADIDSCLPTNPCLNNGTCEDGIFEYTCICAAGYTGQNCQFDIDECASNPCENGGSCTDAVNGYSCTCAPGYTGTYCEQEILECTSDPCQNGGTCVEDVNSFLCSCVPGFSGTFCQINDNECFSVPCLNDGICIDGVNQYVCLCASGFTGDICQTNINDCLPNPCQNGGVCTDGINNYTCVCTAGYTGSDCQTNVDECASNPCRNEGTCTDGVDSFTCFCTPGWTGDTCLIDIDECASNPCENGGSCTDAVNGYSCTCAPGYVGTYCEQGLDQCQSDPCLNAATCLNVGTDFICECPPGFAGDRCEIDINECSSLPCQNGATCIDGRAMFTCQCRFGYSGMYCEIAGFCDIKGDWYNECNDKITITKTSTGLLLGDYMTSVEILTGISAPTVVVGYSSNSECLTSFGFTVVRENGLSTTSWTGQCQLCDDEEILYTTWINTRAVNTCEEIKTATRIGQDKWTRYMQSQAPRERP